MDVSSRLSAGDVKQSNGRGNGWMTAEDRQLPGSVLHVGQYSVHGSDQKYAIFWEKIHAHFLQAFPNSGRTSVGCSSRWKQIQHEFNLFCVFFLKAPRWTTAAGVT